MENIANLFFKAALKYPDTIAIIHKSERISYKDLAIRVRQVSHYLLREKGIKENDKVLVFIPMSIDLYAYVLALFSIGATAVFVDEWASVKRIKQCCERVPMDAFIASKTILRLSYFVKPLRNISTRVATKSNLKYEHSELDAVDENTSALITFTTGSTSIPKAADRTHEFLKAQFDILSPKITLEPGEVSMVMLPIVLFCNLGLGITSLIGDVNYRKPEKTDFGKVINELKIHKVKLMIGSPFFIEKIAEHKGETELSLWKIITGGAPVFPDMADRISQAFTETELEVVFGSTEAEPISTIDAEELLEEAEMLNSLGLAVGEVHVATQCKIIRIEDGPIELGENRHIEDFELLEGELGEIIVAGDHVLKRYYNSPEAYKENKIIDGETIWHRTGDSGIIKNNRLYLNGRCRQLLHYDGKLYSPFILENQLNQIENVRMGTYIKIGDHLAAVVELKNPKKSVKAEVHRILPEAYLKYVKKIPRDPRHNSKIDYDRLEEMV